MFGVVAAAGVIRLLPLSLLLSLLLLLSLPVGGGGSGRRNGFLKGEVTANNLQKQQ